MKPFILLIFCYAVSLVSCNTGESRVVQGLWKIQKVEIMKGPELERTIVDTASQYWNIHDRKWIDIFARRQLQSRLNVKMSDTSIRSFDAQTGALQEEFMIEKSTLQKLELVSRKTVDQTDYDIVYYLDKVEDSEVPAIMGDF